MVRRYDDPVEVPAVAAGDGRPVRFRWRGRWYVVRGVLAHWVERGEWWRPRGADGIPLHVAATGRRLWRVEAARAATGASAGVYDLAHDEAAGSWTLARTLD